MNVQLSKNRKFNRMFVNILSIFVIVAMVLPTTLVANAATGSAKAQESSIVSVLGTANITVDTMDDELNVDGDCSLREAIQAANTDTAVDACPAGFGADVIGLPAGVYYLSINGPNEDGNLSGDLDVFSDVSVQGDTADTTVIDGGTLDRVLDVVSGTVTISGITIRNGSSDDGGGGILNRGTLTIEATTITANTATFMIGGGIKNETGATMTIHGSTISGNTTEIHHGGGIVNLGSMTIDESTINDNASNTDGGGIDSRGPLTIRGSVIQGNHANGLDGGGIYSEDLLILENTVITENTAAQAGGGVASYGTLEATNTTVQDNSAAAQGGGLSTRTEATAKIVNSTISGNTASGGGGGIIHWFGLLTLTNSTVSDNTAEFGGGIYNDHQLVLSNSTIFGNTASLGGGVLNQQNPPWGYQSVATLKNTILAKNTSTNCEGIFNSANYNLIEDVTGCTILGDTFGNITGMDPMLGSLQDNGGPTQTHALLAGSPAIDSGNPDGCTDAEGNPLEVDQRGEPRPVDGNGDGSAVCDIGTFEAGEVLPSPNPWLIAFPENDAVEGWEWPEGTTVTLTIDNAPEDFAPTATAAVTTWGDPRTYFRIYFGDAYKLKVGDQVTLTGEDGTTRTHTVQNLSVTDVNADADTVSGTADIDAVVQIWPHGHDQDFFIEDTAEDGTWFADFGALGFHTIEETGGRSQIVVDGNATAVDWNAPVPPSTLWRDEFDGTLAEGWSWLNENPAKWNLTERPGFLRIYTSPGGTGAENLLLRPVAQGDFVIKTHVLFNPDTNFQFAGLVIWQDQTNFLQLGRAFCDVEGACVGNGLYFDKILGGNSTDSNFATAIDNPSEVSLRLERRDNIVRAFYSMDEGISWYEIGIHGIPDDFQVNAVGLTASQNTGSSDIPADFDFFELSEGWGFLPEGFHDYDQGDVPNWACNAGGWAADPDDRAARLNVDIVVDDQTVASLVAGDFRQDLLDAGVCEGGNCGFSTSLWDVISSYEPHRVDVWAQDNSNGDWVLLSNSAKTLTCRTYDIYTFDPDTGTIKQITNLRDMHEYNPRWSPNGTKIVHDAWNIDWSSHGVYITDIKSGVSTPLVGGESGSYPTWAPNDKWIAFDRGADNDYRIFIVPPTGGNPNLVRDDAFMASWAPNSQRLAFHQPSDGSIRTMNLNGQNVTLVAERGNGPAWSPDGEWIAFEVDGDIWKVHVNNNGNPLDGPVQLTSSPAWEGRPTWSYDSKTIAFHAGMGQDTDIWTIPAAGGTPTWLTGAPNFGDYDANYSLKGHSKYISYSSFSPDGQAARQWGSAFSYDVGTWAGGDHSYYLENTYSVPQPGGETTPIVSFTVSGNAPQYDGYVLLRGYALRARLGEECPAIDPPLIRPDQNTRFYYGWITDTPMTYAEAVAHFNSMTVKAYWDDMSVDLLRHEIFSWSSVDWEQYVCSATEAPPQIWQQVNTNGFGDPQTNGISSLEVFHDQLYAGASNWNSGGQVWRQEEDGQWQPMSEAGFGKGSVNPAITDLAVFHDQLYAGIGWDGSTGEVWRSADGTNWEPITSNSFGDDTSTVVSSFAVFGDMLYAGTGGGQIWRSETGDSNSWTRVAPDGLSFYGNVTGFAEFNGALYAAIESSSGEPMQVWRSDNGSDWTTVTVDGFGDPGNISSGGFAVFDGFLYLGTRNDGTGGQIWRTADGTSWEQVVGNGFSDVNNVKIESLFVYGDKLYAGTNNLQAGIQILRSADGVNWMHVNVNGFGDSNNFATLWSNATVEYQGKFFIGTWNNAEGGELWMYTP